MSSPIQNKVDSGVSETPNINIQSTADTHSGPTDGQDAIETVPEAFTQLLTDECRDPWKKLMWIQRVMNVPVDLNKFETFPGLVNTADVKSQAGPEGLPALRQKLSADIKEAMKSRTDGLKSAIIADISFWGIKTMLEQSIAGVEDFKIDEDLVKLPLLNFNRCNITPATSSKNICAIEES
ncbi:hypothetical protein ACHAPT_010240 [Fusarium lateritium]